MKKILGYSDVGRLGQSENSGHAVRVDVSGSFGTDPIPTYPEGAQDVSGSADRDFSGATAGSLRSSCSGTTGRSSGKSASPDQLSVALVGAAA